MTSQPQVPGRSSRGYALLTVLLLGALMLIAVAAATPPILNQGRREREAELIWRGEQYARSIRLFYRKNGRFPQKVEDLVDPKNGLRYLRQAYKEPMNREDGSWRYIYLGSNGQLIGSLTRQNLLFAQGLGAPPVAPGVSQTPGRPPGVSTPISEEDVPPEQPEKQPTMPSPSPQPLSGPVIGGNIIGVASKVDRPSLRIFEKGRKYIEWEFLWDPTRDAAIVGQPGQPVGQPPRPGGPTPQRPPNLPPLPQP